jgi:SAM-dependent methyltransferase
MTEDRLSPTAVRTRRRFIYSETLRGKTIGRTLLNWALQERAAQIRAAGGTGPWLDLAGGQSPSYYRVLALATAAIRPIMVDICAPGCPGVVADLNRPLPFREASATAVIFLNALHIFPDPQSVLRDTVRVLKPGGLFMLAAPVVFPENPEPHDCWRFTGEGLRLTLNDIGFSGVELTAIGERWTTAASLLTPFLRPKLVRAVAYLLADWLDGLTSRHFRLQPCPMTYLALSRKTE